MVPARGRTASGRITIKIMIKIKSCGFQSKAPEKTGGHPKRDKASSPHPSPPEEERGLCRGAWRTQGGVRSSLALGYSRPSFQDFGLGRGALELSPPPLPALSSRGGEGVSCSGWTHLAEARC